MSNEDQETLVRDATRIFLRLRQDPKDSALRKLRDDFLAQGAAHRAAYREVEKAWSLTGRRRPPKTPLIIAFLAFLIGGLFLAREPLRIYALADFRTGFHTAQVELASGDRAMLDAASAVIDRTAGEKRRVELLDGAAFFDVDASARAFVVQLGPVTAAALGTSFETSLTDGAAIVAVKEGRVVARVGDRQWTLRAGDRLTWSQADHRPSVERVGAERIASWREDRLIADGLTFSQVAEIIDRRIPGGVVILDDRLADFTVSGGFDLSEPEVALRALAAAENASVVSARPLGALILPTN